MRSHGMTGAVSLIGIGLCGIASAMLLQVTGPRAEASPRAVDAFGPGEPTVVWYGTEFDHWAGASNHYLYRAWSDGRVEAMAWQGLDQTVGGDCYLPNFDDCRGVWFTISDPQAGYAASADFNADEKVDGVDLAAVLGYWGDAPRNPFPPSDCPLGLIP